MKRYFFVIAVIAILICGLSSCGKSDYVRDQEAKEEAIYQRGYEDGYDEGRYDGYEDGYDEGYFYGYEDGYNDSKSDIVIEAIFYAKEKGGWHPEEALMIIDAYRNKEPFYEDGSSPSKQDYYDAIDSLIYFFEFFY